MPNWITMIESCDQGIRCANSKENSAVPSCGSCRLAPGNETHVIQHWRPAIPNAKHPVLEAEKRVAKQLKVEGRATVRRNKDRKRRAIGKIAVRAERRTEQAAIVATKNSGRSHQDGDHVSHGYITLDTKLQSGNINPVVHLFELEKIRRDARRGGNTFGGLVLRNKFNVGVVVMNEDDFHKLTSKVQA